MNIDQQTLLKTLADSVSESLEGLAFVDVEDWQITETISPWNGKGYHTYLDIDVPLELRLHLLLEEEITREIVATILAEEAHDVPPQVFCDTLGEILNTLAGKFSGNLLEEQEPVIGLPVCKQINQPRDALVKNLEIATIIKFQLDLGIMFCILETP